jgi:hypothetical protein
LGLLQVAAYGDYIGKQNGIKDMAWDLYEVTLSNFCFIFPKGQGMLPAGDRRPPIFALRPRRFYKGEWAIRMAETTRSRVLFGFFKIGPSVTTVKNKKKVLNNLLSPAYPE